MAAEDERKAGRVGAAENVAPRDPVDSRVDARPSARPGGEPREARLPLERIAAEFLKRGLSAGRDVSESIFPKDFASNLAAQLIDARHGLVSAIANEVGHFLRQADIASEVRKVLAGLSIEAKVQLRFSEDESGKLRARTDVTSASGNRKTPTPGAPDGK